MADATRLAIVPSYSQIAIGDYESDDVPEWEEGDEPAVASSRQVLVATQAPTEGVVDVELFNGAPQQSGAIVFDGILDFRSGIVSVSSVDADDQPVAALEDIGLWKVQIQVSPSGGPASKVCVWIWRDLELNR